MASLHVVVSHVSRIVAQIVHHRRRHMGCSRVDEIVVVYGRLSLQNVAVVEQQQVVTDLLNFLAKWLYGHILSSDIMIGKLPATDDWMLRDNPCEFTDEFRTGIDFIDNEHQELFRIIERANNLVKALVSDSYDDIMSILGELEDYTKFHFSEEEEYMESIHYEGLEAQKRAHAAFIDRLEQVDPDEIDANPQEYLNELLEFLLNWLINHILYTDKKIPDVTK